MYGTVLIIVVVVATYDGPHVDNLAKRHKNQTKTIASCFS